MSVVMYAVIPVTLPANFARSSWSVSIETAASFSAVAWRAETEAAAGFVRRENGLTSTLAGAASSSSASQRQSSGANSALRGESERRTTCWTGPEAGPSGPT